ncbi:ABC transporter ATP-binding protein [Clostridium butyricum]|uniref:ABC transporter ATP-binding protein n=1 Tax=Clostridium butyricum TaxID=1492 RepID=A0A0A6PTE5_CLOBU|nr:ABC transporter ATP-binding protein [Clostridium butyricum]KHD13717.1 hypothetical protein OA81_19270 [Clostridium butyricum]KHD15703.1 hypothetical protein OA81_07655 [Clostridium butyricum]PPV12133.1 hypothetical protein AWN73_19855 [Clostridium butyricum]
MNDKDIIKKLLLLFKPHIKSIMILICCLILSSIFNLFVPLIQKEIMDEGFIKNNFRITILYTLITFLLVVIDKIVTVSKECVRTDIYAKLTYLLKEKAYNHISKLNIGYFNNTNYAETLNNINMDVENISRICEDNSFFAISEVFKIIGGIIGLIIISWKLTIIVLFFIPLKYIIVKYFAKQRQRLQEDFIENNSSFANWFGDTIGGIREIRLFNILENKLDEFRTEQNRIIKTEKNMIRLDSKSIALESVVMQLMIMFIYIIGAKLILNLELTVGSIFAFTIYSNYVITPISSILNIKYMLAGIIPSTKRFYEFLELEEEEYTHSIIDIDNENNLPVKAGIKFKDVCFTYPDKRSVLKNMNFSIDPGEKVAIIGTNGAGKSTILNLMLRFYKPSEGLITLNNINIEDINIQDYRNYISVVSQQVYLFNQSIRHNITLYSNVSEDVFNRAIYDSQLSELIYSMSSDNFNVGQNGKMLSGGEKQKIALARALVQDRPILVFDEATSNLDIESEININKLLNTRFKEKTVVIVTHRTEILKNVDKIILIEDGEIQQIGSHDELMLTNDLYRRLISISKNNSKSI